MKDEDLGGRNADFMDNGKPSRLCKKKNLLAINRTDNKEKHATKHD